MTVGDFLGSMLDAHRYRFTIYQDDGSRRLRFEPVIVNAKLGEVYNEEIGYRKIRTWTIVHTEMFIEVWRNDGNCKR